MVSGPILSMGPPGGGPVDSNVSDCSERHYRKLEIYLMTPVTMQKCLNVWNSRTLAGQRGLLGRPTCTSHAAWVTYS